MLPSYAYQKKLAQLNFYLLLALAATLLFDQGRYKLINYLLELVTLTLVVSTCLAAKNISIKKQIYSGSLIIVALLFCQLISGETEWPKREIKNFIFMLCVIAAVTLLPNFSLLKETQTKIQAILGLTAAATISYLYLILVNGNPFGTFENPHFLSLQTIILVNLSIYFCLKYTDYKRVIGGVILIASIVTMALITSRIAWVALGLSLLLWAFFLCRHVKYIKFYVLFILIAGIFSTTLVTYTGDDVNKLATKDNAKILQVWKDERVIVWTDSLKMQKDNSAKGWLTGNGLGSFKEAFDQYSSYGEQGVRVNKVKFTFPHNFFLEILFTSGVVGLLTLLMPLAYIIIKTYKATSEKNLSAILALTLLTGVFTHTFFTLPLFSSFPSISLGLIIGYCLWVSRDAAPQHD